MSAKLCFAKLGEEWFRYPAKHKRDRRWMVGKMCCIVADYPKHMLEITNPVSGLYSMKARTHKTVLERVTFYLQFLDGTVIPCNLSLSANVFKSGRFTRLEAFKQQLLDDADRLAGGGAESVLAKAMVEQAWSDTLPLRFPKDYKGASGNTYRIIPPEEC